MSHLTKIAVSIGDINGVGLSIALAAHEIISQWCDPLYIVDDAIVDEACKKLHTSKSPTFRTFELDIPIQIEAGIIDANAGRYSFASFVKGVELAQQKKVDALVTLPIHKEAWAKAGIKFKGHTDYLRHHFGRDAIMMLGNSKLFVALFTEHIPLREVPKYLTFDALEVFLLDLYETTHFDKINVLGLNPHAGDGGVLGNEEELIDAAIQSANHKIGKPIFFGPSVPDVAFTPHALAHCNRIAALYHDQGLAPLKALYFDESINISLNLPIIRASVDHGTAFDIAYTAQKPKIESYLNAVRYAIDACKHLD